MIRRRYLVSGRVQGVGFRATTSAVARNFRVVGSVKNLSDGRVEIVVEAEVEQIEAFIDAVQSAMKANISDLETHCESMTGEFSRFGVSG